MFLAINFRWICYSASDSAYRYTFLCSVVCLSVCLSVVCRIHAPRLNRSTDLDYIWQVESSDTLY